MVMAQLAITADKHGHELAIPRLERRVAVNIDDFKFKREPTDRILFELEQRIDVERITGGPPEPIPGEYVESPGDAAPMPADEPS